VIADFAQIDKALHLKRCSVNVSRIDLVSVPGFIQQDDESQNMTRSIMMVFVEPVLAEGAPKR